MRVRLYGSFLFGSSAILSLAWEFFFRAAIHPFVDSDCIRIQWPVRQGLRKQPQVSVASICKVSQEQRNGTAHHEYRHAGDQYRT